MGSKPSNALKAKRPESGGTIKLDVQEKSRLMDNDKEEFAQSQKEKNDATQPDVEETGTSSHRITGHEDELNG
jgi:hypothetical protein